MLLVTVRASLEALLARYRRRLIVAAAGILLYGFVFALSRLIDERETGLVSMLIASAWATLAYTGGMRFADLSLAGIMLVSLPAVLPLLAAALAPWSLSRIRHV